MTSHLTSAPVSATSTAAVPAGTVRAGAAPAIATPEPSTGIVGHLAEESAGLVRWCTPSLLAGPRLDPWQVDVSISYARAGSMLEHSGWFADAEDTIRRAAGSDRAFIVPAGSTAANQITLRAIARHAPDGVVLVDRQAHHSVIRGLAMFGLRWQYLDVGRWDDTFECPRPVKPRDVARSIRSAGNVAAVCLVSTTYAGELVDLAGVREVLEDLAPAAILMADEAWGSHLAFHPDLAPHRATRFAHVVSQSTHKAAGALQPGAVLLWNDGPLPFEVVDAAYLDLMSTSASFVIAGSIEHAFERLRREGAALIDRSVDHCRQLADGLRLAIPGARLLADERPATHALDPTKVTVALPAGPVTGYEVRDALAEAGIVVEKATPATVTFLATFSLDPNQVERTIDATAAAYDAGCADPGRPQRRPVPDPFAATPSTPEVDPWIVQRAKGTDVIEVPIHQAVGAVAAEQIEAYPPGVAVISEGFEVTADAIEWLEVVRAAGGSIVGRRPQLDTLRVLDLNRPVKDC